MEYAWWKWITDESALQTLMAGFGTGLLLANVALCLVVLSKGANWMIDGVVNLAQRTGLSEVAIGATIVSLGTTAPEAFVSVMAAWLGNPGLALGNGVGSIIADTGLIFGLTCILAVVPLNRYLLNRTGWVQVGAATLLVAIACISWLISNGSPILSRGVGLFFLMLLAGYLFMTYRWTRQAARLDIRKQVFTEQAATSAYQSWAMVMVGLMLVIISARILIAAASEAAVRIGVPDDVIAATMVAFGTSLPELMTAITSVHKGHPEIALGNVIGADVLNCLFVIGAAATAKPLAIPSSFFYFHFPAMLFILWSFRWFIFINRDSHFRKWQGAWLLTVYLLYVVLQYTLGIGGNTA